MINLEKYNQAFIDALDIDESKLTGLIYQNEPSWDSISHMELISKIEESFDIIMEPGDIINLSTYENGKKILAKYGIFI